MHETVGNILLRSYMSPSPERQQAADADEHAGPISIREKRPELRYTP